MTAVLCAAVVVCIPGREALTVSAGDSNALMCTQWNMFSSSNSKAFGDSTVLMLLVPPGSRKGAVTRHVRNLAPSSSTHEGARTEDRAHERGRSGNLRLRWESADLDHTGRHDACTIPKPLNRKLSLRG